MDQTQARAENAPTTSEVKGRRRIDQLTLEELAAPLTFLLESNEDATAPRERWTPGRTARLTRDLRAARLAFHTGAARRSRNRG
jgi:hypothetical protein